MHTRPEPADGGLHELADTALPGVRRFFSAVHGAAEAEETLRALDASCAVLAAG